MTTARAVALALAAVLAGGGAARADKDPHAEAQKLIKKLSKDKDAEQRSWAAERLGSLAVPEAVPALAAALKDKDSAVRANAAGALLKMGEAARDAMPALQDALFDADSTTVWNAAGALSNMGVVTTDLMPAYRRLLKDPDCDISVSAAAAISEYAAPEDLLPIAIDCRHARSEEVGEDPGSDARKLMREIAKDKRAIPFLAQTLRNARDAEVREYAAGALGDFGPPAKSAIPALEGALADTNDAVRAAAGRALKAIDPKRR
jgi:HEAT repeat protein